MKKLSYWEIFGETLVPCIKGDSNKDAGLFIDMLAEQNAKMLALLRWIKLNADHIKDITWAEIMIPEIKALLAEIEAES